MDHLTSLRDLDSWKLYAQGLEAHVSAWHEHLSDVSQKFLDSGDHGWWYAERLEPLTWQMTDTMRQAADRYDRIHARLREADRLAKDQLHPDQP